MKRIAIIGGGPAGLMAAEQAATHGAQVELFEAKPSVGRKFLIAGKSGLNLTNTEAWPKFRERYSGPGLPPWFTSAVLDRFDASALREWVHELGLETFSVRSGKVFPRPMKAAPLLRAWLAKLRSLGVNFHPRHKLEAAHPDGRLDFTTPESPLSIHPDAIILTLGGASWHRTGSDGSWPSALSALELEVSPWQAANCGWEVSLPDRLREIIEGHPFKNLEVRAGAQTETGELMPTRYGFEGTPLYALGPILRSSVEPGIEVDFKPMFSVAELERKMESVKSSFPDAAPQRWKLSAPATLLISHLHGPFRSARELAIATKSCRIPLTRPRPINEAISSAGGLQWNELTPSLQLKRNPGFFAAGEMLDWEAPTGGYLLQACLASGYCAGISAAAAT